MDHRPTHWWSQSWSKEYSFVVSTACSGCNGRFVGRVHMDELEPHNICLLSSSSFSFFFPFPFPFSFIVVAALVGVEAAVEHEARVSSHSNLWGAGRFLRAGDSMCVGVGGNGAPIIILPTNTNNYRTNLSRGPIALHLTTQSWTKNIVLQSTMCSARNCWCTERVHMDEF